jgi:hypothetical protein
MGVSWAGRERGALLGRAGYYGIGPWGEGKEEMGWTVEVDWAARFGLGKREVGHGPVLGGEKVLG